MDSEGAVESDVVVAVVAVALPALQHQRREVGRRLGHCKKIKWREVVHALWFITAGL